MKHKHRELPADGDAAAPPPKKKKRRAEERADEAAAASVDDAPPPAKTKKKKQRAAESAEAAAAAASPARCPTPARQLPPHQLVLAPMVGGSELPFRLLARRHGAQLCYTPMIYCGRFVTDAAYRAAELRSAPGDAPLVAHFCGNDPDTLLAAARLAAPHVVAVDLNLGCPQRCAHSGNFGAHLASTAEGRATALRCVRALARALPVPVFAKIRLQDDLADTLTFAAQLREAGAALLAVHARYRGSATRRRDGAAHLDAVRAVKEALPDLPILSNGNVRGAADVLAALQSTGADGVMSAEGALDDPALFARAAAEARTRRKKLKKQLKRAAEGEEQEALREALRAAPRLPEPPEAAPPARAELALEYMQLAAAHAGGPSDAACARFHVRRMCREPLAACALGPHLDAAASLPAVAAVARRCAAHAAGAPPSAADDAALAALARAAACDKRNAAKRDEFVGRMARKAKREGKPPDFYSSQGAAPPTEEDTARLRGMDAAARLPWWNARFSQHCLALHAEGHCARAEGDHGCAYLHQPATAAGAAEPLAEGPTWLLEKEEKQKR
jgi:tRNA-dihydrouridine synthase 1